ncbi:hypothetical protein [Rhodoferax sp.]|uniref:hypothetical protein n=1 Tax=Rhodoferax sp. TaxID=50421 RepID=UPI002773081E|nr:hypothetical protein [Rhodoferax sp.]
MSRSFSRFGRFTLGGSTSSRLRSLTLNLKTGSDFGSFSLGRRLRRRFHRFTICRRPSRNCSRFARSFNVESEFIANACYGLLCFIRSALRSPGALSFAPKQGNQDYGYQHAWGDHPQKIYVHSSTPTEFGQIGPHAG